MMAFTHTTADGVELWVLDIESATAKKLTDDNLNANMGSPYLWSSDGNSILVRMLSADRKPLIDGDKTTPTGPTISINDGKKAQNRTYQDLLKNANDEFNFEQLATSTLNMVDLEGNIEEWKSAGMYKSISFSPDGEYVLVSEMSRPFSYLVPFYRFPFTTPLFTTKHGEPRAERYWKLHLKKIRAKGFMSVRPGKTKHHLAK